MLFTVRIRGVVKFTKHQSENLSSICYHQPDPNNKALTFNLNLALAQLSFISNKLSTTLHKRSQHTFSDYKNKKTLNMLLHLVSCALNYVPKLKFAIPTKRVRSSNFSQADIIKLKMQ